MPGACRGAWLLIASCFLVTAASCTDLQLSRYRDDSLLANHRYALGESYLEVNGIRLCYQEMGQGPDLLIIPGLATNIDYWQLTIPALAEHFRVVAVDPPGMGKSDKPDAGYELPWIVRQIEAFMQAKGIERAHVMGGSLGGHLALLLALQHPERVDRMVLMGSCGAWPEPGPLLDLGIRLLWNDPMVIDHLRRNWPTIFADIVLSDTPVSRELLRYQMAVRANLMAYWPEGQATSRALRSIFYNTCRGCMERITTPVLLIWGDDDRVHLLEEGQYMAAHLPDATLLIVPQSGHEVMLDQPRVFNETVLLFLREGKRELRGELLPLKREHPL